MIKRIRQQSAEGACFRLVSGTYMHWLLYFSTMVAADYLNNYATVTLASGDGNHANILLQTVDPFNPNSNNTHIEGDVARAVAAFNAYRRVASAGGADLDCAGGKGNNPVVAGPVQISGADTNRLVPDHDGAGCE
ncbi:calcium-binding protein [Mesorhizobium sp. M0621]|uniref:calcium-binding protein n=1 Tax=Mesorhizobium sp. M0621 TaxID=2956974 RepID=UPI00333D1621